MQVSEMKVLYMENPLGIDRRPWFSWKMASEKEGTLQTAYQIRVSEMENDWSSRDEEKTDGDEKARDGGKTSGGEKAWDSGRVESGENLYIDYEGAPLKSRTRYRVEVTVWDNHGNQVSGEAWFETALLAKEDWKAEWAVSAAYRRKGKKGFGKQPPATMFRKAFALKEAPIRARVYATCHGIYELSMNGKCPDERLFAPEHTSYGKYLCYQTYDVTRLLKRGDNVLGMYVGDGWYLGPQTLPNIKKPVLRHAVLFQLEVIYRDGTMQTVCSDGEVETAYGPVRCADLFSGEKYDANEIRAGWDEPKDDMDGNRDGRGMARQDGCDMAKQGADVKRDIRKGSADDWKKVKIGTFGYDNLVAQLGEPVMRECDLPVKEVRRSPKGEWILDFGQVLSGFVRMRVSAPKGTEITLEHTEVLDKDGNYTSNILAAGGAGIGVDQKDMYISDGVERTFEPTFTYHGFRYVRVSGLEEVRARDFVAVAISTRKKNLGTFETSDARLNRLYENTRWSQRANMTSIPTDCPQREKAGWTGDMLVYSKTALLNEDCGAMFFRWLENVSLDQEENGVVPMVVPNDGTYPTNGKMMNLMCHEKGQATSSGWGDAAVIVPYRMYEVSGDTAVLRQQFDCMKKWCDYIIQKAATTRPKNSTLPDEVENYLWDTGYHYGEWLIPSQSKNGLDMKNLGNIMAASACYTAPIFGWFSVDTFARICGILAEQHARESGVQGRVTEKSGQTRDEYREMQEKSRQMREEYRSMQEKYGEIAEKMKLAIQKGVIREDGSMPSSLMGAYVLLIYFDLVPERFKETFAANLVKSIEENDMCMDTGFLGTPFLLDALCKIGREDLAYTLLWQEKAPSWLSEVDAGATTIWENCFGYDEQGNPGQLSFNHYSFGCVDDWMFRYIGGIDTDAPGFRHIIFAPRPDGKLEWAKRSYETPQGKAACEWRKEEEKDGTALLKVKVEVPCNATASVRLPDGTVEEKGSGTYEFSCRM